MGLLNFRKKSPATHQKNLLINAGDELSYANGSGNTATLAYKNYLESVQAVNSAITISANLASGASFSFFKQEGDYLKRLEINNIDDYMANDYESYSDFVRKIFGSLFTFGSCLITSEKSTAPHRKGSVDFFVANPTQFRINTGTKQTIESFTYKAASGNEIIIPYGDCIYMAPTTDVSNQVYALPRLRALNNEVIMAINSQKLGAEQLSKGNKRSGILSFDNPMPEDKQRELSREVRKFIDSQGAKFLMLDEKLKFDLVDKEASAEDIIKTLTHINNTIYEFFGIPPFLRGNYESSLTDRVVRIGARLFFETHLKPYFNTVEAHFTTFFRQGLGIKNAVVKFNYENMGLLDEDRKEWEEILSQRHKQGVISLNEYRGLVQLEPLDHPNADLHFLPSYLQGEEHATVEHFNPQARSSSSGGVPSGPGGSNNEEGLNGAA